MSVLSVWRWLFPSSLAGGHTQAQRVHFGRFLSCQCRRQEMTPVAQSKRWLTGEAARRQCGTGCSLCPIAGIKGRKSRTMEERSFSINCWNCLGKRPRSRDSRAFQRCFANYLTRMGPDAKKEPGFLQSPPSHRKSHDHDSQLANSL